MYYDLQFNQPIIDFEKTDFSLFFETKKGVINTPISIETYDNIKSMSPLDLDLFNLNFSSFKTQLNFYQAHHVKLNFIELISHDDQIIPVFNIEKERFESPIIALSYEEVFGYHHFFAIPIKIEKDFLNSINQDTITYVRAREKQMNDLDLAYQKMKDKHGMEIKAINAYFLNLSTYQYVMQIHSMNYPTRN
jgi:hypothetical protein